MINDMTQTTDKTVAEGPETTRGGRIYVPLSDIFETDQGVSLMLDMPGVAPDDVDITLEKRVLTIRGSAHAMQSEKLGLDYAEYGEGDYERAFTLSEDFDPDKIEAAMQNGVLTVTLPRAATAQPRKITVNAG